MFIIHHVIIGGMKPVTITYPTHIQQRKLGDKLYVLETIRDLDEAIDLICEAMTPEEQLDPFAEDLCPYFGILWPAAEALSQYLCVNPDIVKNQRVLELGCGLGLPSLVASHLGGNVLATDFHPDVEAYFKRNCRHSSITCSYQRLNWREDGEDLGLFDVVMGSDILYESKHASEVAKGLIKFLRPGGTILLADPGRSYLQRFIEAMARLGHRDDMTIMSAGGKDHFMVKFTLGETIN